MTPIEQAKAALQAAEEYLIADEVSVAHLHLDRALAALSAIEGSGEPVALSDEDFERMDDAFMRDGYPDHHTGTRIGRTHYMMWLRDKGHLKTSPSLSVDEVMEVVKEELRESEGGIVLGWCIDEDTSSVEALDTAIRERLTKAIKL
jgi:hypothetical protein